MISFRNMLTIRSLSLFRTGVVFVNRVCNDRFSQLHRSNFHQCLSMYIKREELICNSKKFLYDDGNSKAEFESTSKKTSLRKPFARLTGRYQLMYTCKKCNTRNTASISKVAYHHGTVVASCSGCKANHLIADNLKWFGDKPTNIEDILKEKGETVNKVTAHDLFLEVLPPDAPEPTSREEMKKLPPLAI